MDRTMTKETTRMTLPDRVASLLNYFAAGEAVSDQAAQGRREGSVLRTRPTEDAEMHRVGGGRSVVRRLALLTALATFACLLVAGPAAAESAWWHITSGTRPAHLVPGHARNEVRHLVVAAGSGSYFLEEPVAVQTEGAQLGINYVELPFNATATEIQTGLAGIYGAGNVEVAEVAPGSAEFDITFKGERADQPIELAAEGEVTLTTAARGRPDGEIYISAENLGTESIAGQNSTVVLKDTLPPDVRAVALAASKPGVGNELKRAPLSCTLATLTCTMSAALAPYDQLEMRIPVVLEGSPVGPNTATVSGGQGFGCQAAPPITSSYRDPGCINEEAGGGFERTYNGPVPPASVARSLHVSAEPAAPGVEEYDLRDEEDGGAGTGLAGSHPFQFTTTIALNQTEDARAIPNPMPPEISGGGYYNKPSVYPVSSPKDLHFQWPPGLIGDPTAFPTCTSAQFFQSADSGHANACPPQSAIGVAAVSFNEPGFALATQLSVPLFNLKPEPGEPARFGFNIVAGATPVVIDTSLRADGDYGVTVETNNITQTAGLLASQVTVWGNPGDPRHNRQRGWACLIESRGYAVEEGALQPCASTATTLGTQTPAFLTTPTSCTLPASSTVIGDTWADPLAVPDFPTLASTTFPTFEGCNQLPFAPKVAAEPTAKSAASSSGLNFDLDFVNEGLSNPNGRAESAVKKVTVALPKGVTTNPSVANGLQSCSLAQFHAEELGVQTCPEASKIGEVEIQSPLVEEAVDGAIYVAKQNDNPSRDAQHPNGNLLSIYMVAKNPNLGVLVKSAGAVTPDPQTGQLSTTFDELPQLPFNHFHLHFREGSRAPLITPGLCGSYSTQAQLYPYANPQVPVERTATFTVNSGANGQPCASSEAGLPNKPTLSAGTVSPVAASYSPLVFKVNREDGSQALGSISAALPEGLLGKLAGVTECSNAQIAQAESRSGEGQGATELASPSCPAASQVGTVNVGTGAGPNPFYVPGKAYLAGPYKGAPLSLAIITPAVVGPFDLGTIVVRTALQVDPMTTQITAVSDPIPTIVHGLPTVVRSVSLNMDRPNFTLNPTSCEPKQITAQAVSTLGNIAPLQNRFQASACAALGFKPSLKLSLSGQTKRAGHPALKAVLTYPKGSYANIAKAQVALPGSEFLDQGNLNLVCKQADLKAGTCPKNSIYGKVKAWSPLLDKPLVGNVYLGVGFGYKLPALVAELNGQIRVLLVGKVDTDKDKGIRNTFLAVPDAAVSRFELSLKGGKKYGLLENSENICKKTQKAEAAFTAQNGKLEELQPTISNSCGKKGKKKSGAKKKNGKGGN
jgi:hypothetical protein